MALNQRAAELCEDAIARADVLGIAVHRLTPTDTILDFGMSVRGSIAAGLHLADICFSRRGATRQETLSAPTRDWPAIAVATANPLQECMASQYAGWQWQADSYAAMCSGPIRALYAKEKIFESYPLRETSGVAVGLLETNRLPDERVFDWLRQKLPAEIERIYLCVARTRSDACRVQIVARSVETACHKLFELGFDLNTLRHGEGIAALPPIGASDFQAMGSTNDAILFTSQVRLVVDCEESAIEHIGPKLPSSSSPQFGQPFAKLFDECGRDFYKLDPLLFAPAEITLVSARTGKAFTFGGTRWDLYHPA